MILNDLVSGRTVTELGNTWGPGPNTKGVPVNSIVETLKKNGVGVARFVGRNLDDIAKLTEKGHPVIAVVRTGDDMLHAVILDGVTKVNGRKVVAVRDPGAGPISKAPKASGGDTSQVQEK